MLLSVAQTEKHCKTPLVLLVITHLLMCTTIDHTQPKVMAMWIIGYSFTTNTDIIKKYSIGTDTDSNTCIGRILSLTLCIMNNVFFVWFSWFDLRLM